LPESIPHALFQPLHYSAHLSDPPVVAGSEQTDSSFQRILDPGVALGLLGLFIWVFVPH